jgi:hypothetical protein
MSSSRLPSNRQVQSDFNKMDHKIMQLTIASRRSKGIGSSADLHLELKKQRHEAHKLVKNKPIGTVRLQPIETSGTVTTSRLNFAGV